MLAWLQWRKQQRWEREDARRRELLERTAFADGRFVMYISVAGRQAPICFLPREDEAPIFFTNYLIPWMRGELKWLSHSDWGGLPGAPTISRAPFLEVLRGYDVHRIVVMAPNEEYRSRLDTVIADLCKNADAKAEANRLAERSAAYSMMVASMKDAHRAIEEDGR
jgi:hypothetical protein